MTGADGNSHCPLCGGRLHEGTATIPFVFERTTVVVKDVPAEVCQACHEAYASGAVTDTLTELLNRLRALRIEVTVVSFADAGGGSATHASH